MLWTHTSVTAGGVRLECDLAAKHNTAFSVRPNHTLSDSFPLSTVQFYLPKYLNIRMHFTCVRPHIYRIYFVSFYLKYIKYRYTYREREMPLNNGLWNWTVQDLKNVAWSFSDLKYLCPLEWSGLRFYSAFLTLGVLEKNFTLCLVQTFTHTHQC